MDSNDWKEYLVDWSTEAIDLLKNINMDNSDEEKELIKKGYLGNKGVSDVEIFKAELLLNIKLPTSYKNFLKASNGFYLFGFDVEDIKILPIEQVGYFKDTAKRHFKFTYEDAPTYSDEEYRIYTEDSYNEIMKKYLISSLLISNKVDSGLYLLNPRYSLETGEAETCRYLYKLMEYTNRYINFEALMKAEKNRCLDCLRRLSEE